jgi:hypothetical protein
LSVPGLEDVGASQRNAHGVIFERANFQIACIAQLCQHLRETLNVSIAQSKAAGGGGW